MGIGYHNSYVDGFEHAQIVLTVTQADGSDGFPVIELIEFKELSHSLSFVGVASEV